MTRHPITLTFLFTGFIAVAYGMGIYLFGNLLPDMKADLGFSPEVTGRIAGAGQLGTVIASLGIGAIWVRLGAVQTLLACQAVNATAMILAGLSSQPWQFMLLMGVLGACAASTWVVLMPVVQVVIADSRRGVALGVMSSGLAFGVFLIGLAAPVILGEWGWRGCWFAAGGLAVLCLVAGLVMLSGLAPIRPGVQARQSGPSGFVSGVLGAGLLLIVINTLAGLSFHPFQTYLTLMFRELHRWSMPEAAALWSSIGIGGMIGGVAFGLLADRIGVKRALVLANLVLVATSLAVWLVGLKTPVHVALFAFGLAYNAIWGLYAAWVSKSFGATDAARLMGLTLIGAGLGGTSGNYAGGIITGLPGGFNLLYGGVFVLVSIMTVLSLVLRADRMTAAGAKAVAGDRPATG